MSTSSVPQKKEQPTSTGGKGIEEKLRGLMRRKDELIGKTKLTQRLEFGHSQISQYLGHSTQVKGIIWNPNLNCFASYDEKNLHLWDPTNTNTIFSVNFFDTVGSHSVSCVTYSTRYRLYLAVTTDFKLLIFNELLRYVKQKDQDGNVRPTELKVRLVNNIYFWESKSKLITAGVGGCFVFDFCVKTKYDPKQALFLDPDSKNLIIAIENMMPINKDLYWLKGLKVVENEGMIFSWSQEVTCFNRLDNADIVGKYHSLTSKEDYITDLIISEEFKYFITSTVFGQIYVWKLNVRGSYISFDDIDDATRFKNMKTKRKLIHSYSGHSKKVTSLAPHPNNTSFISASLDNTVRVWCLDKFIELYCFEVNAGLSNILLLNDKLFACFYYDKIKILKLQHLASSFCNPNSVIKKVGACYDTIEDKIKNNPFAIYVLSNDNSAVIFDPKGKQMSTIYPPPTAKELKEIEYSIKLRKIFILLSSGTICIYSFDQETALLEKLQRPEHIKDSQGKSVNQLITTMNFVNVVPPKYDCEVLQDQAMKEREVRIEDTGEENMIVLGFSKGTFAFVSVHNTDKVYARFSIHRQPITRIEKINFGNSRNSGLDKKLAISPIEEGEEKAGDCYSEKNLSADSNSKVLFMSMCSEFSLNIWGFENDNIIVYKTFKAFREIEQICFCADTLMLSFHSRDCELMSIDPDTVELQMIHKAKVTEHSDIITCMTSSIDSCLFVTGGKDGNVKVWTSQKELVREICFPEKIDSLCFLNEQLDILVGHACKVSIILATDYRPFTIIKDSEDSYGVDNDSDESPTEAPKTTVTDRVFERLKLKDEQMTTEKDPDEFYIGTRKKRRSKGIEEDKMGDSFYGGFDPDQSAISKADDSDEEFITEELFQKALQAALEQEMRKKARGRKNKSFTGKRKKGTKLKGGHGKGSKGKEKSLILEKYKKNMTVNMERIAMMDESVAKFKPLCTALPTSLPKLPNIAERIRAAKRLHMTRRDMTEQKIVKNIIAHNDPSDVQNFEVLYISNKNEPFLPEPFRQRDVGGQFPPI
ncbi:unnamed protein product [Moneuplotes crassus]|uniref:Uncharacterized protein n=1 Tax=Euplotes crassus TaxID=5936 RepID=A0AAD1XT95_EUPCR|nr:unnamed protein product [Moneuplotes crassus]